MSAVTHSTGKKPVCVWERMMWETWNRLVSPSRLYHSQQSVASAPVCERGTCSLVISHEPPPRAPTALGLAVHSALRLPHESTKPAPTRPRCPLSSPPSLARDFFLEAVCAATSHEHLCWRQPLRCEPSRATAPSHAIMLLVPAEPTRSRTLAAASSFWSASVGTNCFAQLRSCRVRR